jgi:hypothetical protein
LFALTTARVASSISSRLQGNSYLEQPRGVAQARAVRGKAEDPAFVDPLASNTAEP